MHLLSSSTVRLIASSQVITSVSSVVKELVENSLDAGASSIEIKLDGWGLERIEIRDNGGGIKPEDAPFMAQPHYTSKITSDNDLKTLETYGFRGEALGSLCTLSNVSILTKTESEQVGMLYTLDRNGKIEATQPKPTSTGTTVIALNLFKNLPVRKQFSSGNKKCKEELKKVEDLIVAYGLMHPSLRIALRHNKTVVWQKSKVADHRTALLTVFGTSVLAQLGKLELNSTQSSGLHVVGYLPRPGSDPDITGRAVNDRCFVFFNGRPVIMKQISQLIKQFYNSHTNGISNRFPVTFLSIRIPPENLDVNLEPNKTSVMLTDKDEIMTALTNLLEEFYSDENRITSVDRNAEVNSGAQRKEIKSRNDLHSSNETCKGVGSFEKALTNVDVADCKLVDVTNTHVPIEGESMFSSLRQKYAEEETVSQERLNSSVALLQTSECGASSSDNQSDNGIKLIADDCSTTETNAQVASTSSKNDMRGDTPCHERTSYIPESKLCSTSTGFVDTKLNDSQDKCDTHQGNTKLITHTDSNTLDTLDSEELFTSLGDETLGNFVEFELEKSAGDSQKCSEKSTCKNGVPKSNHYMDKSATLSVLNAAIKDDISIGDTMLASKQVQANKDTRAALTKDESSSSPSLKDLFSIDLDDVFNDSDMDFTFENVGEGTDKSLAANDSCPSLKTSSVAQHSSVAGKTSPGNPSVNNKHCPIVDNPPVNCYSGLEARNDKEWSMGRGLVDKNGNIVKPVTLLTSGPPRQLSLNTKAPVCVTPLQRKRKHSLDQENSRLSLSRKKIRKIPEITSQPLISKLMSPNPLQRKLLYKKTEIPFSLSTLRKSADKRKEGSRLADEGSHPNHLIGRLDPWGVWLLQQGTNIVCMNQYRVQEQLLFQRLMSCHSLPKERLDRPIVLNERTVGGPECWRVLCEMSSKSDPPDPTRFFDDERLTANGFDICQRTDPDTGVIKVELFNISSSIPFYGVPDLAETLGLICRLDDCARDSLSRCRPLKVVNYLQGEAVRVARGLSSRMNRTEVKEILSRMETELPEDTRACVHDRPFFVNITRVPK